MLKIPLMIFAHTVPQLSDNSDNCNSDSFFQDSLPREREGGKMALNESLHSAMSSTHLPLTSSLERLFHCKRGIQEVTHLEVTCMIINDCPPWHDLFKIV